MEYVPYKQIESWKCLACGKCCRRYAVNLTWKEYREIKKFRPDKVRIKKRKPYLKRKADGRCEFLYGDLCSLQALDMKPVACKVWPFKVLPKPAKNDREFDGLYQTADKKEYFVYINPRCSGINKGNPFQLQRSVEEIIAFWNGSKKQQRYSTSNDRSVQIYPVNEPISSRRSLIQIADTLPE